MIPISNETTDNQGNRSRLWVLTDETFLGTVSHFNGKISIILSDKIINFCTNRPVSLESLRKLQKSQVDLAYVPEKKELIISPHWRADGKDDLIAQVATKSLNPKPPASWVPPLLAVTPDKLGHIFSKEEGHFTKDTPDNRAYILSAVSHPDNKDAVNKFGLEMYSKVMPDGYRAWAHVKNGLITNGGRDKLWLKWIADPDNHKGGRMQPRPPYPYSSDKFTFKERVQADRLTEVYNKSIRNNPWTPHPAESKSAARDVGEIHHQASVIMEAQRKEVDLLNKQPDFSLLEMIEDSSTKEKESWCSLM
jgi:hypothetical protein